MIKRVGGLAGPGLRAGLPRVRPVVHMHMHIHRRMDMDLHMHMHMHMRMHMRMHVCLLEVGLHLLERASARLGHS